MRKGSGCRLAAVHGDDLARHEAGVVGCEELDDIRDVINVAEAAGRDCRRHGGGALLTPGEAVQAAGGHRAGGDGVDADALGGYLERRGPGEAIHRMLAGAVERRARAAPLPELGRERVAFLVAPSRDDDGRALAGERRGRRSPDAGQGPGDYYYPSAHVMPSPIGCRSGLLPAREPYVQHTGDSLSYFTR